MSKNKKGKIKEKLTNKFRLVILNEDSFQELFSLKLSLLNVFVLGGLFSILLVVFTSFLIAFTSLKEYIPGYSSTALKKKAIKMVFETDSLKGRLALLENYTKAIRPVLTGEIKADSLINTRKDESTLVINEDKLKATKQEEAFREKLDKNDPFPLAERSDNKVKIVFFAPIKGIISEKFSVEDKHFAVDITAKKGTPVKAIADGTVILSEWTADTGYVIAIQHANEFISVCKHNGNLLKQQGDFVKSGEVIGSVGSTGELTTGTHLHLELWSNGYSVNPESYIDFQ